MKWVVGANGVQEVAVKMLFGVKSA